MSITIEAGSVAELRKIFEEMFGVPPVPREVSVPAPAPAPPAEAKPKGKKAAAPAPEPEPPPAVDEVPMPPPPADLTYDVVLDRIKALKAGSQPDIIARVKNWRDNNKKPSLKDMDVNGWVEVMAFLDTLEN